MYVMVGEGFTLGLSDSKYIKNGDVVDSVPDDFNMDFSVQKKRYDMIVLIDPDSDDGLGFLKSNTYSEKVLVNLTAKGFNFGQLTPEQILAGDEDDLDQDPDDDSVSAVDDKDVDDDVDDDIPVQTEENVVKEQEEEKSKKPKAKKSTKTGKSKTKK